MSFRVYFEIGHKAAIRSKRTIEGFTHDWEVYVQGLTGIELSQFVEKVVFHLHVTFPNPKRVIKEPPYILRESGYAGFIIPIDIYLRNNEEPKKISFSYDLNLQQQGPAISKEIKEKYIFTNPSDEFRHKLLKAGLTPINDDSSDKSLMKSSKISSVSDPLKKYKSKDIHKQEDSFTDLFGTPITKSSVKGPEIKAPVKSSPASAPILPPKADKNLVVTKKNKSKHVSKEKDKDKERDSEKKDKSIEKKHKEEKKSKERSKDKERKEKLKNDSQSPSPKRPSTPTKQIKEEKIKEEKKEESKSKLDKQIKEDKNSKDEEKSLVKEEKKKDELQLQLQKSLLKEAKKKEGKERDKDKDGSKKEHKSHKESKEYKEKKITEMASSKKDAVLHKKEKEPIKDLSMENNKPEKKNILTEKSSMVPEEKPVKHKHKKKENKEKKEKKEEKIKEKKSEKKEKSFFHNIFKEDKKNISTLENNNKTRGLSALETEIGIVSDSSTSSLDDSSNDIPLSIDIDDIIEKKRKRKHDNGEASRSEEPSVKQLRDKSESKSENKRTEIPEETTEMSPEYINSLKELQQKIMTLQNNDELQKVVQLIANTGHYEITPHTFDFDLCALDRETVRRLQEFFALA